MGLSGTFPAHRHRQLLRLHLPLRRVLRRVPGHLYRVHYRGNRHLCVPHGVALPGPEEARHSCLLDLRSKIGINVSDVVAL